MNLHSAYASRLATASVTTSAKRKGMGRKILKEALGKRFRKRKVPERGPEYGRMEPKTAVALPRVDDYVDKLIAKRKQHALEHV